MIERKASSKARPASHFTEHARKQVIRSLWCKPQLQLLHGLLRKKLIYIGLPDIEAKDVLEWIDYLDRVIAFQCSTYKKEKIDVKKLDDLLEQLERQSKIKSFFVYQGWMEDIIMGGTSERGERYQQSDFLKIYNLDFCNTLTYPRKTYDDKGKVINIVYKKDVIERLLQYQKENGDNAKGEKFIMYLTINSNEFNEDISKIKDADIKDYINKLKKITKPEVLATRKTKVYCFNLLSDIFQKYDFQVEFLPPVFYFGSQYPNREKGNKLENHRMITFTILGTKRKEGTPLFKQDRSEFLNRQFIFADDKKINCFIDNCIEETNYNPNVIEILKNSHTYKNLWAN